MWQVLEKRIFLIPTLNFFTYQYQIPFYLGQEIKVVQYTQLELLHLWHCQIDSPEV